MFIQNEYFLGGLVPLLSAGLTALHLQWCQSLREGAGVPLTVRKRLGENVKQLTAKIVGVQVG